VRDLHGNAAAAEMAAARDRVLSPEPPASFRPVALIDDAGRPGTGGGQRPARRARSVRRGTRVALRVILPGFVVEVALLTASLEAIQLSGYGSQQVRSHNLSLGLLLTVVAWAIVEARFKLYRRVWPVAGFPDVLAIAYAVALAAVLIGVSNAVFPDSIRPFRYLVAPLAAPSAFALICGYRLWSRLWAVAHRGGRRLLVVAPGSAAFPLVRWMIVNTPGGWEPVAVLTMSAADQGSTVHGVPVVGDVDQIQRWSDVYRVDGVAFIPSGRLVARWKTLVGQCLSAELPIFVVPSPEEALQGRTEAQLRSLTSDDLVGRTPRTIDLEQARPMVSGQTVMVTGAAGSIGSELCRLLTTLAPRRLVLVDNNESGLFEMGQELRTALSGTEIHMALVSIVDREPLDEVFQRERPSVVFHAAAYKHVPMLEDHPEEAVRTNVLGTRNVLACADAAETGILVLISTDKAVSRQSIMGCSKRLCERMILGYSGRVRCWAVRFGNVVGSRGSVVPTFERQIKEGGPVTITHPEATRYLMTIGEAASLVVSTLSQGRPGHLYMLDMGEPISIENLARSLIRSRGFRPHVDIEIVYTGLRPGEALTEDLLAPEETSLPTENSAVMEVRSPCRLPASEVDHVVEKMGALLEQGKRDPLVRLLRSAAAGHVVAEATAVDDSQVPPLPAPAVELQRLGRVDS
jgi:FlaA1/EpsC-like NDP-sugar epimerase